MPKQDGWGSGLPPYVAPKRYLATIMEFATLANRLEAIFVRPRLSLGDDKFEWLFEGEIGEVLALGLYDSDKNWDIVLTLLDDNVRLLVTNRSMIQYAGAWPIVDKGGQVEFVGLDAINQAITDWTSGKLTFIT